MSRDVFSLSDLERALRQDPANHEAANSLGNAYKAAGDLEKAADCYRRSLSLAPGHQPALYNLGLLLHELNQLDEAEALFRRAHEIVPGDADVLIHLGVILCKRSRFMDGADMFLAALRCAPEDSRLWLWLGRACHEIPGQIEESIRSLRNCIALAPESADAHCELGVACRKLGDVRQAAESFGKALALQPDSIDALSGLGDILQDEGRLDDAIAHYRAAIRSWPDSAMFHSALGCALARKDLLAEAADCLRKAIGLQADFADAIHNLGIVRGLQGARDEALRCSEEALRLKPGDASILEVILFEKQHMCDWSGFEELSRLQRRRAAERLARPSSPFSLLAIPSTRAEQLQAARSFAQFQLRAVARDQMKFDFDRPSRSRLRIGYLSSDFHEHATAYLMAELFELHDRHRFEILAYSYGADDGSPMRARLAQAFDRFTDIGPLSHAAAAAAIHADGTDILVDLKGYTQHARTGIVALRPAPVQVSYLGYPGTMGAEFIDYLIADRFVVPAGHAAEYSEQLVRLPGSYQVNDRKRPIAATPSRRELGLPEKGFVFCCFNQTYKIVPETFSVWMRLLQAVPGSILWLLESNPWVGENLSREAGNRGVDPRRLVFAPKLPLDRHLGRLRAADLFLDTMYCNAHTTASDALWAGLPVLTLPGDTFAARVAGSLLGAIDMPELIAGSIGEYENLALSLAREPARLAALRDKLARNRDRSPLFDTPGYVRNLESAFERMWQQFRSGQRPRAIDL
jgi:predicted O-linked N-acetylglucosamine transferase (SPINDLY family)